MLDLRVKRFERVVVDGKVHGVGPFDGSKLAEQTKVHRLHAVEQAIHQIGSAPHEAAVPEVAPAVSARTSGPFAVRPPILVNMELVARLGSVGAPAYGDI